MQAESDYYKIDSEKSITFLSTHILVLLNKTELKITTSDLRADRKLKEAMLALQEKEYISEDNYQYFLTDTGTEKANAFQTRYSDILTYIDIFSLIDLEKGEFAFQKFGTFSSDDQWTKYSADSRWSDLRIAMLDYLDGDATELVFAQMSLESHISINHLSFPEISDICDNAIQEEDLSYKEGSKFISGSSVLDDIYDKAIDILKNIHIHESEILYNLTTWYANPEKTVGYGSAIKVQSNTKPIWETPWSL